MKIKLKKLVSNILNTILNILDLLVELVFELLIQGVPVIILGGFFIWVYVELKDYNNDTFNKIANHWKLNEEDVKKLKNVDNVILTSTCKSLTELSKSSLEYQLKFNLNIDKEEYQLNSFNLNTNKEIVCSLAKGKKGE